MKGLIRNETALENYCKYHSVCGYNGYDSKCSSSCYSCTRCTYK